MNPDDDDAVINQLKYPRLSIDYLPKLGLDFIRSLQNRSLQHHGRCIDLQAFAEDELVRKEYKEMHCEMPGVPRSTFLMVFSPDGTKVASTHGNHNIYITDLRTGKNIKTLVGHPRTPWCIAFHPSYNDIIASGCLGGQVRIWDLTGGSEIWTAENETVIASIAFHPIDRMLVIATFNELHFWDWSKPKPFACIATSNPKEKVRYVEFDRIGLKLITGITNVPHSRWDRTRTSCPNRADRSWFTPPSPPERWTSNQHHHQHRRRGVGPRIISYSPYMYSQPSTSSATNTDRVPLSSVPERERRITACYRNLVHEYELLVHRYLQVYSPPSTMDRGTDPMEMDQPTAGPSTSSTTVATTSTNFNSSDPNATTTNSPPSTSSSSIQVSPSPTNIKLHCGMLFSPSSNTTTSQTSTRRRLLLRTTSAMQTNESSESSFSRNTPNRSDGNYRVSFKMRIKCSPKPVRDRKNNQLRINVPKTNNDTFNRERSSFPLSTVPLKRPHPTFKTKKAKRKPILDTSSSDNTSSDENAATKKRAVAQASSVAEPVPSTSTSRPDENAPEKEICLPNFIARCSNHAPVCTVCNTQTPQGTSTSSTSEITQPCASALVNTNTNTTDSTVYTPSGGQQVASQSSYFSVSNQQPHSEVRRIYPSSTVPSSAPDEVINYAERSNSEDDLTEQPASEFHPFDPPPEFPSINPENIGIGNMYSNIVQDLESSLNNVRSIRASNRPGETSDMLSSFSDRLESIMQQSDSILRNLSQSMEMLPANSDQTSTNTPLPENEPEPESPNLEAESIPTTQSNNSEFIPDRTSTPVRSPLRSNLSPTVVLENIRPRTAFSRTRLQSPLRGDPLPTENIRPRAVFNDGNFYVREMSGTSPGSTLDSPTSQDLYNNRSAIASDHTYHADIPRVHPQQPDNLTPLMTSLHLTISHIRRQARLLRRQVDSIERIDRAMLEVAQLQSIRQLFGELRRHLSNLAGEHRSTGVSSVRQMMAGTRISDSSPGDSGVEHEPSPPPQNNTQIPPNNATETQPPRPNNPGRKQLPPSRLLHLQRQHRRFAVINLMPRRYNTRSRYARQRLYLRPFAVRHLPDHGGTALTSSTLSSMIRRLESHLTVHIAVIGHRTSANNNTNSNSAGSEVGEMAINERLQVCRTRMNRIVNGNGGVESVATSNVTPDGASRFTARDILSRILDTLTYFLTQYGNNRTIPQSLHIQIRNVVDLTSLLSDILLLQIVDSIPPPTGINLNSERESLSASIDEMCSRMLQRRIIGQSHTLNRSLRLMRLTTRYAAHALDQTYNARCNAIFSNGNSSRRELLGQIHSTLRSIRNRGMPYYVPLDVVENPSRSTPPLHGWHPPMHRVVSRISDSNSSGPTQDVSDEDNDSWFNSDHRQSLYRTTNVNLVEEPAPSSSHQNRMWNVPTVQINDVPVSESFGAWQSRVSQHRIRLSDLRSNPMLNFFRPRFLHPLYAGGPLFDNSDLEDRRHDHLNEGEAIMTFTPNHRIQAWDISSGEIPDISNSTKNIVVGECKIHNDASVDISTDGTLLVTLLPSGGYLNVTNRLGVYSLRWESLGQILYITSFEQNVVSVSLSPLSRHLVVGLASRRVSIIPNERWTMARIFLLSPNHFPYGSRLPVLRELEQSRDSSYMSLNCIRWLPVSGQGLIIATNTGQLRILS